MRISSSKTSKNGMVATSQPLAAKVGRDILAKGGNAVDAAIATAVTLTVVEPSCNGIGGDVFAQVWINNALHGLNASSVAPQAMTIQALKERGYTEQIPKEGWLPVTVPGAPAAWKALHQRWGSLPFIELMQPAIDFAEQGYAVSPTVAKLWADEFDKFQENLSAEHLDNWLNTFAVKEGDNGSRPPKAGDTFYLPDHARTLRELAATNCDSFYSGDIADAIDNHASNTGGLLRKSDLANYQVEWVEPISTDYRGYDIWEMPPNGQGLVVLMALNMLKGYAFSKKDYQTADTLHTQIEALKLAYTDGQAQITQLDKMQVTVDDMLSTAYAKQRQALIKPDQALLPFAGEPSSGGTVYLATADSQGNMVSFIQSNFYGFGSGVVVPNTGIALHGRGHDFSLDANHPNCLEPGKRCFHTIIPGFITQTDAQGEQHAIGPFGVMGAYMQPQGQLQVLMNMIDFDMEPQAALDAPRWQWFGSKTLGIEPQFDDSLFQSLKQRGHDIEWATDLTLYGRGQIIWNDHANKRYIGGTEPRCDGYIATVEESS